MFPYGVYDMLDVCDGYHCRGEGLEDVSKMQMGIWHYIRDQNVQETWRNHGEAIRI